jgi:hypothetical protein
VKKKNILILVYEAEVYNAIAVAKLLQDKYEITFFCCDWFTAIKETNFTLIKSSGVKYKKIFDIKKEIVLLNSIKKKFKINYKKLKEIEKKYLNERVSHIAFKDFSINNIDSPRKHYYHPKNKEILYKYYELILKKIEKVINSSKYSFVYSAGTSNLVRNFIMSYAKKNNIPYYSLRCRFGLVYLANCSQLNENVQYLLKQSKELNKKSYLLYNKDQSIFNNSKNFFIKEFILSIIKLFDKFIQKNIDHYNSRIKKNRPNYFQEKNRFSILAHDFNNRINKYLIQRLIYKNQKKKIEIIKKKKFIYFPLHVVPEGGVFDHNEYEDEYYLIKKISKLIPVDYLIIVKPHLDLFNLNTGESIYRLSWFKKINNLKNVEIINHTINNDFVIKNCKSVISISGSLSLEAALLYNKISFTFAKTELTGIKNLYIFDEKKFLEILNKNLKIRNDNKKINIKLLNNLGANSIHQNLFHKNKTKKTFVDKYVDSTNFYYNIIYPSKEFSNSEVFQELIKKVLTPKLI